jgi:hypothetical protein
MFVPVGKDADHAQHGDADHLPGTPHAQGKAIEVDVDHIEVGERAGPPCLQAVLQRGDHARHRTLGERRGLQQRLERAANPTDVAACQVRSDHDFIDLWHSALIARDDARRPFFRVAAEEGSPRQRERDRAGRSRERPLSHAIAVASSDVTALVGTRPQARPAVPRGRLSRSQRGRAWINAPSETGSSSCARASSLIPLPMACPPVAALQGGALVVHFTNRRRAA